MAENSTLKIAASVSLAIHLLFLGLASSSFQDPKILRMPTRYVKVTLLPMVTKEEPKGKITLPVPLNVGDQNHKGPAFDREEPNGENAVPSETIPQSIPFEEPKTFPQQREEGRTSKEPIDVIVAEELPSGSKLSKEENSVSSKETPSNGENHFISLPSLRSGESYGDGFSFDTPGGGSGAGKASGNGSPAEQGSGKGRGILGKFFFARGGGNGTRPSYADNPKPIYPPEAKEKGYEGEVVLRVEVLANGRVGQIEIRKSSSHELLDRSALTAVKQWRFLPAKKGDVAIPLWVNIPVRFQLQ
jgi:TonB family protein